jgi:predicted alpha/beta-hydrolase family hydrolase
MPLDLPATDLPAVRGFLHRPEAPGGDGLVLAHGAGGSATTPLLIDLAVAFAAAGLVVLRCDLPFRQARATGPPRPGAAERDREGLRHALRALRERCGGKLAVGGISYGGRQASMVAAAEPGLVAALLLLAYPLHRPGHPEAPRTQHFPSLRTPALFVHGTFDAFGSVAEVETARRLIPARTGLLVTDGGHDLGYARAATRRDLPGKIVRAFGDVLSAARA